MTSEIKRIGVGRHYYSNGDYYDGAWVQDKRSGMGKMIYEDGSEFTGEF